MGKQSIAVVGSGPAGLAAAFALHNDLERKYDVAVFEMSSTISLNGHSYEHVDPTSGLHSHVDVPMRVFSGRYYQNLFNLLEFLNIPTVERHFLFAFADMANISKYYFLHPSNNHRLPMLCPLNSGVLGILSALWKLFIVALCYVWFSMCCFWIAPHVRGRKSDETETIREYLSRLKLPKFYIEDYVVPLFSSVASSPHEQFLDFPATYLSDYKRETHMFAHNTISSMALLQSRLCQGISVICNSRITKVERFDNRLKLYYQHTKSGEMKDEMFDRVILAVSPRQISRIYPPTSCVMDKLRSHDVYVTVHQDHDMLPPASAQLIQDQKSELIAMQTKYDPAGGRYTVATHAHPCGVLITTSPEMPAAGGALGINPKKVLHTAKFARLLATTVSRESLAALFREDYSPRKSLPWVNGEDGVYICGGWAWDGFALLEGCMWSGLSNARSMGAVLPFEVQERKWH